MIYTPPAEPGGETRSISGARASGRGLSGTRAQNPAITNPLFNKFRGLGEGKPHNHTGLGPGTQAREGHKGGDPLANGGPRNEHDGVQIKVWIPEELYDLLAVRAAEHGTNRAAEARALMMAGLRAESLEHQQWDHLERLAWKGTVETMTLMNLLATFLAEGVGGETVEAKQNNYRHQVQSTRAAVIKQLAEYLRDPRGDVNDG